MWPRSSRGAKQDSTNNKTTYSTRTANGSSRGLVRGANPRGWLADVAYVPSSENRSHGASLGAKLRRYCNGVKCRYVFT